MGKIGKTKKLIEFENYVIDLFKTKYQSKFNFESDSILDEFENNCFKKAKELGMDLDELALDGEFAGFDTEEEYKNYNKNFWFDYYGNNICQYNWK